MVALYQFMVKSSIYSGGKLPFKCICSRNDSTCKTEELTDHQLTEVIDDQSAL